MPDLEAPDRQDVVAVAERGRHQIAVVTRAKVTQAERTQDQTKLTHRVRRLAATARLELTRLVGEEAEHGRAILFAPVYLGCGAIVWFTVGADPPPQAILAGLLIFSVCFFRKREAGPVLRHLLYAGMLLCAGMGLAQCETWRASTIMLDSAVTTTITGRVERREADDKGRWRYEVALEATEKPTIRRAPDEVTIFVRKQPKPFDLGDRIQGRVRLTPPAGPALPGLHDFAFGSYFDGIGANGFAYRTPTLVSPAAELAQGAFLERADLWLAALRSSIGDRIRSLLPGDTGAFAASLVTDERRAISDETTEALRTSGLAHIVAISGLNMALSAGIFYVGLRYALSLFFGAAQAWPTKKIAAFGALVTVTAYYMISGFGVSAERAFIMMAIMLIAVLFDRPSLSLRNVALSAIIILVLSPSQALGPSFQMSYAATLALVSGYSLWTRRKHRDNFLVRLPAMKPMLVIWRFFSGILSTSFIGGASTAIFSIEHFHRLATYGLVANLAAMPVVSFVVMPFGMVATMLMPFGLDAFFWKITGAGLDVVTVIAKSVAAWGGNIPFGRLPVWLFPTFIAGFLLMTLLRTRLRHVGALLILASVAVVALSPGVKKPDLLISEDGSLVALLRDGTITTNREKPPDFIFEQWQKALALTNDQQPPTILPVDATLPKISKSDRHRRLTPAEQAAVKEAMDNALDSAGQGGFACQKRAWCVAMLDDGDILVVIDDAAYLPPACDTANIVVTSVRLRLDRCRSGAMLFTGATLRHTGSIEMDISSDKPVIAAAFQDLTRAWNRHRAYDWRTGTFAEPVRPTASTNDPAPASDTDPVEGASDNDE
ncbi:MAG: ComEC/Rec2 family competence protein [Rhizobiaceae bacterium]|nr:ComEC/Rec2 family competence protein [Rhizobiaceae bacterium]